MANPAQLRPDAICFGFETSELQEIYNIDKVLKISRGAIFSARRIKRIFHPEQYDAERKCPDSAGAKYSAPTIFRLSIVYCIIATLLLAVPPLATVFCLRGYLTRIVILYVRGEIKKAAP